MIASESVFDTFAHEYDSWFDNEGSLIYKIELKAFQEVLPSLSKPWLEVGVGSGRFAKAIGIDTGIDPSINLLKIARRRGINVFHGSGEYSLFERETFGTVFLIVTLCFVKSPAAIIRQARRVLKQDGKLAIGLVLRENPWGDYYQNKKWQGHRFYRHATFYSFEEVQGYLKKTGFSIEQVLSTLFQKPGEVKRMEIPLKHFYRDAGFVVIVAGKRDGKRMGKVTK
jgi:SAM-dependent methyltransferase